MIINKDIIKKFIPKRLWRRVRLNGILKKHHAYFKKLDYLTEDINDDLLPQIKALQHYPENQKIIWQYWAQGLESDSIPDLVRVCLKSVERYASDFTIIRISDKNISKYIEIPGWLSQKKAIISKAHFADLLRCVLLSKYGGLWLDASVFLTGDIPSYILNSVFFMYRRDDSEKYKEYWQDTFAYYWGWSPNFMVKTLIGIMYAKKGNKTIADFASILLNFWKKYDTAPDYFFFQILIEAYLKKYPESVLTSISDTIPHLLRQYINENPAPNYSFSDILQKTTVHSLNYKNDVACKNLLALFPEYRKCLN